ncbi:MAG: murein L,D-transpeptidase family protein [Paracoccaceae bacterium]
MILPRRAVLALVLAIPAACSNFRTYDGPAVTSVVVHKAERRMYLLNGGTVLRDYKIGLGGNPIGPKRVEGDLKTPEGAYRIDRRNPNSQYHLSLGISYPSDQDRETAKALGKPPGGDIFIHGRAGQNRGRGKDWTAGCIAVRDREMEEIYSMVRVGTPIYILP